MNIYSFSQRISKIYGNKKFCRFGVVLKLEFEVKNWYMHTKQLPNNLGCHCGVGQLSGGVSYPFSPFSPSLNFLKFHMFTPALRQPFALNGEREILDPKISNIFVC